MKSHFALPFFAIFAILAFLLYTIYFAYFGFPNKLCLVPHPFQDHLLIPPLFAVQGLQGLIEKSLLDTSPLDDQLTEIPLGIDATFYLNQVFQRDSIKQSLTAAIGGVPAALKVEVEKDLARFKSLDCTVMFMFNGLDLHNFNLREDKTVRQDQFVGRRKTAWDVWQRLAEKGRYVDATEREELAKQALEAFESGISIVMCRGLKLATSYPPQLDLHLMEILYENGIHYKVAPASAKAQVFLTICDLEAMLTAQLAYWNDNPDVELFEGVYSDTDILLYNIDRVIYHIDWDAGKFNFIYKKDLQTYKQAALPESSFQETFLDACIIAGGVYDCPILPSLAGSLHSMGPVFTFERAIDLLRTYGTGIAVIRELAPDDKVYLEQFARTKTMIQCCPVSNGKSHVITPTKNNINDLATVITPRLAAELYFYISRRLVGTKIWDFLMSDHLKIQAPLCGGESQEYKNLLMEMIPLRTMSLGLMSSHSNRFFHHKHLVFPSLVMRAD